MTRNVRMYNPTHRYDTTGESGPTNKPAVQWSYELDEYTNEIAVWDGQMYAAGGGLSVFDTDGNPQWRFQTDHLLGSSPAVVDGTVYIGDNEMSEDSHVYAVDAASGTERWRFETSKVISSPAVVDGTVYVGDQNTVYALEAASGTERWRFETEEITIMSPAVVDGTVYVPSKLDGGTVYALDATTGTQRWSFQMGEVQSSPAVVDGTVYVGSGGAGLNDENYVENDENGRVYALDAATGTQRWSFQTDVKAQSSPAVVDGTVYVGGHEHVYALDAAFGDEQWSFQTDGYVPSPAVIDGTVYVTSDGLYALDAADGTERWSFQIDEFTSTPVVKDGTVYVAAGHTVYALGSNGTGNGETELFDNCSACQAELNDYDDPAFCPECGADLSDSVEET